MKGKVVTLRPRSDLRARLDRLAKATGHTLTFHIEKAIEGHLPELEARYAAELRDLRKKTSSLSPETKKKLEEAAEKGIADKFAHPKGQK